MKTKEPNAGPVSEGDRRLGVVVALESVVAYMFGFHAYDTQRQMERKPNTGDNWITVFAYMNFAVERSKGYNELHTLALLLTAVSREALDRIFADRLYSDPAAAVPEFMKEVSRNAHARQRAWHQYREQSKVSPVEFVLSVTDAKQVAVSVLSEFCRKMDVTWDKKVDH